MPRHRKKIIDVVSAIVLLALVMLDAMLWRIIFAAAMYVARGVASQPRAYSLSVTHGTSTLLMLSNGVTILTGAGLDDAIVDDLQKYMPFGAPAYIDLAIIPSPDVAGYEGYQYILQHYAVGAFLYNGRADSMHSAEWQQLSALIATKHIPLITVGAGDSIHYGAIDGIATTTSRVGNQINITAPDVAHAHSPNASDTAIILLYNK